MAQFFISASDSDALTRLTRLFGSETLSQTTDGTADVIQTSGGGSGTAWVFSDASAGNDFEILLLMKGLTGTGGSLGRHGPAIINTSVNGYVTANNQGSGARTDRLDGGGSALLANNFKISGVSDWDVDPYRFMKLTRVSGSLEIRIWDEGQAEPTGTSQSATDSTYLADMLPGLWAQRQLNFKQISAGTNGDPAPTGPVATGPATPINLGVTNLQATSARLTWEQG